MVDYARHMPLQKKGLDVEVYESAGELKPVGAGLLLSPNAIAIFEKLGIVDDVIEKGIVLDHMYIKNDKGKIIQKVSMDLIKKHFKYPTLAILRSNLHQLLFNQLKQGTVHLNKKCISYSQNSEDVEVQFIDGTKVQGQFLVGSDGIHSVVRQQMIPDSSLRYSGQTCWRGIVHFDLNKDIQHTGVELWGYGTRFGYCQVFENIIYWYATKTIDPQFKYENTKESLMDVFRGYSQVVHDIIQNTEANRIIQNDLYDLKPISKWSDRNITLLGDAAHAPTPNLGQGGAQAIEDSWMIAECLGQNPNVSQAFQKYETLRKPKAQQIAQLSYQLGKIAGLQNNLLCQIRNSILKYTPSSYQLKQLKSIYSIDYDL